MSQHIKKEEPTKSAGNNATTAPYRRGVVPNTDGTVMILTGSTKQIGERMRRMREEAKN